VPVAGRFENEIIGNCGAAGASNTWRCVEIPAGSGFLVFGGVRRKRGSPVRVTKSLPERAIYEVDNCPVSLLLQDS
jgi:hypothetical protein